MPDYVRVTNFLLLIIIISTQIRTVLTYELRPVSLRYILS